ncbi:molybdenum cofactor sulfurase [Massilia aurea]|uniref:Molybdenum cofactor sulfurase n=1 Tax=Massilia aurea TaxID=373040 RepID=A0A422QKZ4_9BURK|nr:MOSC domain-containing protein [Massilia aurea]RNF30636.1 molybdenum cofactor sulfurase [Massilia aurea]
MSSFPARPIEALLTGRARMMGKPGTLEVLSGIGKQVRQGALWLALDGLEGDEQGDRIYHGGPEKALHHYAFEHYPHWRAWYPDSPVPYLAGAFGENVSTVGMSEREVHVGDVFRVGETLVQVSQGRQPCFRVNLRFARPDAALALQASGRTGWYYRVLREGWLAAGDAFELVDRSCPDWPLARAIAAMFPDDPQAPGLRAEWEEASRLAPLAERWRMTFERRLASGRIEDWHLRLNGPPA